MKKGIYLPTKQNTIILNELEEYCEILLDGEYKTVSKNEAFSLFPQEITKN